MNGYCSATALAAAFVTDYLERRDIPATLALLTEDVTWAAAPDAVCGKQAVTELLNGEEGTPRAAIVRTSVETAVARGAVSVLVTVDLPEEVRCLRLTLACRRSAGRWRICSVFLPGAEGGDESTTALIEQMMDDYLPGGFLICTPYPAFAIRFLNRAFVTLLGYDSREELLESLQGSVLTCVHPDDRQVVLDCAPGRSKKKDLYQISYRMLKKDGGYLWVSQQSQHARNAAGEELILATYADITAQKNAEQVIATAMRSYEVSLWEWDLRTDTAHQYLRCHRASAFERADYTNYPQMLMDTGYYHPDSVELAQSVWERVRAGTPRVEEVLHAFDPATGEYWWENLCYTTLFDRAGKPIRAVGLGRDVTAQRELELERDRESRKYETLVQSIPGGVGIYQLDEKVTPIYVSDGVARLSGMTREEYFDAIRENSMVVFHPDDIPGVQLEIAAALSENRDINYTYRLRQKDGSYRWCRVQGSRLDDEGGYPVISAVFTDMDEQKRHLIRMEERYQQELDYKAMMDEKALAAYRLNLTTGVVEDGQRGAEHPTVDEIFADTAKQIAPLESYRRQAEIFQRSRLLDAYEAGNSHIELELPCILHNGQSEWISVQLTLTRHPSSRDVICFVYAVSIQERKELQSMVDAIIATDYETITMIDGPRNTYVTYRRGPDGIPLPPVSSDNYQADTTAFARSHIVPEDWAQNAADLDLNNLQAQLEQHKTFLSLCRMVDETGEIRRKQIQFSYLDRPTRKILATRTDITELYNKDALQKEKLQKALQAAEQASLAKTEFLSRMSHEIRTPMNAILGLAELTLQRADDADFVRECTENSKSASQYLLSLLNDVLDMSRIESGKIQLYPEAFDFHAVLRTVCLMTASSAERAGVIFHWEELPGCHACYRGDKIRLQQILVNLLSNAVKFTPAGGTVTLSYGQTAEEGGVATLRFVVRDTGIGIREEFIPHLFESFTQESGGTTAVYGGSGLGLAICKNLVEMMDGTITVESVPGTGSTFTAVVQVEPWDELPPASGDGEHSLSDSTLAGRHILLVEDHPLNTLVAQKLLTARGLSVTTADDGAMGVEAFQNAPPFYFSAILMDIRMPVMDGLTAAQTIRRLPRADADLPIIAMTANAFPEDVEKSMAAGMNAHLAKPIEPQKLYGLLHQLLDNRE
ncbi:MAG: PAS domain-containing protein, partial [Oscillospiraceae bacterium]